MRSSTSSLLALAAGLLGLAASAGAQTLVAYDGTGLVVTEFHGGPDPATCGYPSGPLVASWALPPSVCPTPLPLPPPAPGLPGDVAYDAASDTVLVSDGAVIAQYTSAGAFVASIVSPFPVFGMGVDSATGSIWCTDGGALAYGLAMPPAGACGGAGVVTFAPFPVLSPGPLTDVDWDPFSGTLFTADLAGMITNVFPGGAPGPFGTYPSSGLGFPPGTPLLGLAVDDASPFGPGHLYVTDGFMVEAILPGGGPAPPTFSAPFPVFPSPMPTHGLAFAPHAVSYGAGVDPDGLPAPVNTPSGAVTTPSASFTHTLSGAVPGGFAALVLSTGFACPSFGVLGVPAYIAPVGPTPTIATAVVPASGTVVLPTPLAPGLPVGAALFDQWFVLKPAGPSPLQVSNAVHFRIAFP